MILTAILTLVVTVIEGIFVVLPTIPAMPESIINSIDWFLDTIFATWDLFTLFVRPSTINLVVPLALTMIYFEEIYKGVMFIVRKIPLLGID